MINSDKVLILDWTDWLQHRGLVRTDNIVISEVPVSFLFLDVFLPALSMLPKEGRLFLLFDSPFIDIGYAVALAGRVKKYGFTIDANHSSATELCFAYREGPEFDGVWFSGVGIYTDELRVLFSKVFKSEISEDYWYWKYPRSYENYSVVGFKGRDLVAHYGISPRLLYAKTELLKAAQVGDVMVDESYRGGIKSSIFSGLFHCARLPLTDANDGIAYNSRPLVGFGFPHGRHMKFALRLGVYKNGGQLHQVVISAANDGEKAFLKNDMNVLRSCWEFCWRKMQESSAELCILDRSWSYCLRRYRHHPEKNYDIYVGEKSVFVLSTGSKIPKVIDYVGDVACFITESRLLAKNIGASTLEAWLTDWQMDFLSENDGFYSKNSSAAFAILYNDDSDFSRYESVPWWISMGDADFT
ncbi:MAG: GNAT family N-acetyltransferase [Saccharospirillaceae bacterium]|nr:GNAT family N-acetyltransferase [Saccharospirillaceae bacterium]MCD8530209.1 GNAT family N-acetyltransferase [Saccharospirillaceae bacterium]